MTEASATSAFGFERGKLTPRLWLRRAFSLAASAASLVISLVVLAGVDAGGTEVVAVGGWEAPLGITLVADRLAALMLSVSSAALLGVLAFAIGQRSNDQTSLLSTRCTRRWPPA